MKETYIKEFTQIQPNNPVLIEGLPGLGLSWQNCHTLPN